MTPYYQDDLVTIYHGDCREVMALPISDWPPAVVTDPPYGSGLEAIVGDESFPFDVLPMGSSCIAFGSARRHVEDVRTFEVPPDRVMVWAPSFSWSKSSVGGVAYRWTPVYGWDLINSPRGQEPFADVFRDAITGTESRRTSSVTKPVSLMVKLVRLTDGPVLDPFMGSGSTLVAAKLLGRRAIGIEIEERYCEVAAQRCSQEVLGLSA